MRTIILTVALAFIGLFAYLTLRVLIEHGIHDIGGFVLAVAALLVLLLLGVGIVGALRNPPDE